MQEVKRNRSTKEGSFDELKEEQRGRNKLHWAGTHIEVGTKQAPHRTGGLDGCELLISPGNLWPEVCSQPSSQELDM